MSLSGACGDGRLGGYLRDVHLGVPTKEVDVPRADGILRLPVALASNAVDYTGVLLRTDDPSERNAPRRALMTIPVGVLALLAFGLAGERRRTADALFLWLSAGTLLAGILSTTRRLYASQRAVAELGAAGVPVSRGVVPSPIRPDLVLARVGTVR